MASSSIPIWRYPSNFFNRPLYPEAVLSIEDFPSSRQQKRIPAIQPLGPIDGAQNDEAVDEDDHSLLPPLFQQRHEIFGDDEVPHEDIRDVHVARLRRECHAHLATKLANGSFVYCCVALVRYCSTYSSTEFMQDIRILMFRLVRYLPDFTAMVQ